MAKIKDGVDLKRWLESRPEETRDQDARLIAARAALRTIPDLCREPWLEDEQKRKTVLLPCFRAMKLLSWVGNHAKNAQLGLHQEFRFRPHAYYEVAIAAGQAQAFAFSALFGTQIAEDAVVAASHAVDSKPVVDEEDYWTYANAVWQVVENDCTRLELLEEHELINQSALWPMPSAVPEDWSIYWAALKDHLRATDEGWDYWINWYEDIIQGRPRDQNLELKIIQIDDEIWKSGPKPLNAEIAGIVAVQPVRNESPKASFDPVKVREQVQSTDEASIWDFHLDEDDYAMRARPFKGDMPPLEDPYRMRDQRERLGALSKTSRDLFTDLNRHRDRLNVPPGMATDFKRYSEATDPKKIPPEGVNPRDIERLVRPMIEVLQDDDVRSGLGNYHLAKVEGFVEEHLALRGAYLSAVAERMAAQDAEPPADFDASAAISKTREAIEAVSSVPWREVMPAPPAGVIAGLSDALERNASELSALSLKPDVAARIGRARLYVDNREIAATVVRLIGQSTVQATDFAHRIGEHPRVSSTANLITVSAVPLGIAALILRIFSLW
ncbi:MAG: hypothetical protein AAGK00_17555 [Pseudomonadota bacterium]